jgi:hypothetical protein
MRGSAKENEMKRTKADAIMEQIAGYDDAIRERDEVAATCRALRAELQKVETLWSQARRERNDAVQLLEMYRQRSYGNINALHDAMDTFLSRLDAVRS